MRMYDIIEKKRDGKELADEEIGFFVRGYTDGSIPDYVASAFLMAVYLRGMSDRETSALTLDMAKSGDMLDLSELGSNTADKHSTGGVGDKTTLIVAPIAASLGAAVAKMSGRGLGHTGGTIDKLESIPGYRTSLSEKEFFDIVKRVGVSVVGATENIAPADKKIYALRDVTATVSSVPLIASSVMSKKIASGAKSIVLDIKVGSGAFMKTTDDARCLADLMIRIGKSLGRNVTALLTDMDAPLGHAIGNALEVKEAISVLKGKIRGPLKDICVALAANMVSLSTGVSIEKATFDAEHSIDSGKAYEKFEEWMSAQGADLRYIRNPELLPSAPICEELRAPCDGYIGSVDAEEVGKSALILGAGRERKGDSIDFGAGIVTEKSLGDYVRAGDVVARLYTSDVSRLGDAKKRLECAMSYTDLPPEKRPLIFETRK